MKKQLLILSVAVITLLNIGCKNIAPYPIDDPSKAVPADWVLGKWTDKAKKGGSEGYFVVTKSPSLKNQYHVVSIDKGAKKATFETDMFFSMIGNSLYINVPDIDEDKKTLSGYMFIRLIEAKAPYNTISLTTVEDTTMGTLKSSDEVRAFLAKNMDNRAFYKDTGKLTKVK